MPFCPIPGKGSSDWGYSWIPVVGPIIGAAIAALLFGDPGADGSRLLTEVRPIGTGWVAKLDGSDHLLSTFNIQPVI